MLGNKQLPKGTGEREQGVKSVFIMPVYQTNGRKLEGFERETNHLLETGTAGTGKRPRTTDNVSWRERRRGEKCKKKNGS